MRIFKKSLSLLLAVCMLASMALVMTVASAEETKVHRPVVTEVVNSDPEIQVETNTYYFYMPEHWKNEYNDTYDGSNLDSCSAGIYWYGGDYKCDDYTGECAQGWPGYVIKEKESADAHIFKVDVPKSTGKIIFNATVDGGKPEDKLPQSAFAYQTIDINSELYEAGDDKYGFYPDGIESFDGMIFVIDEDAKSVNDYSGATTWGGDWFYYYGDGTYGIYPTKAEAEAAGKVLSDGQFPQTLQISPKSVDLFTNDASKKSANITPNDPTAVATVEDDSIATITQDPETGVVTVTAVQDGTTKVTFKDAEGVERSCTVTVATGATRVLSATLKKSSIKVGDKTTISAKINFPTGATTYKSSNTKVAKVDSKGNVKGVGAGKATITVTNNKKSASADITVKKIANTMTVKFTKTVNANSKKNITATVAKVSKAQGKVTYKVSGDKKVSIKNGKLTIKKGLKKGKTIKVKVTVTAAGTAKYNKATKTQTVSIKVK